MGQARDTAAPLGTVTGRGRRASHRAEQLRLRQAVTVLVGDHPQWPGSYPRGRAGIHSESMPDIGFLPVQVPYKWIPPRRVRVRVRDSAEASLQSLRRRSVSSLQS
jgi:hypothetical protein